MIRLLAFLASTAQAAAPNFLVIIVDDLNAWTGPPTAKKNPTTTVKIPNNWRTWRGMPSLQPLTNAIPVGFLIDKSMNWRLELQRYYA